MSKCANVVNKNCDFDHANIGKGFRIKYNEQGKLRIGKI